MNKYISALLIFLFACSQGISEEELAQ